MNNNNNENLKVIPPGLSKSAIVQTILLILVSLTVLYCLTYSGTFITDDEHIFSSRAISLAFDQKLDDSRIYGNSRVYAFSNLTGVNAEQAKNVEPIQQILGSLYVRFAELLNVGHVQTLFLLNIGVTALTAASIFGIVLVLGYSFSTSLVVSFLFGLGTIAFPYARTYFRDPLAALFLTLAWGCAAYIETKSKNPLPKRWYHFAWLGLFVFLAAGILSKNTVTIAIPVIIVFLATGNRDRSNIPLKINEWVSFRWKKVITFTFLFVLCLIVWIFVFPRVAVLSRFTPQYYFSLLQFFFTTPHPNLFTALTGPFVSPGKSIILYSPILLLSVVGLIRHPKISWPAWTYLLLLVIGQALFYDGDWSGHVNWGLRFTLPAIPLLMISSAPVIENLLNSLRGRIGLIVLGIISVAVQIIGVLPPILNYYNDLFNANPPVSEFSGLWSVKYSPILWNIKWIFSGGKPDLAAIRVGVNAIPLLIGFVLLLMIAIIGFIKVKKLWFAISSLILTTILSLFMLVAYKNDPAYFRDRTDFTSVEDKISKEYKQGDLVLVKSYGTTVWYYLMNWGEPQFQWTSLPYYFPAPTLVEKAKLMNDPELALDEITLSLFREIPGSYQRVWLEIPSDSPGSDLNLEIDFLKKESVSSRSQVFSAGQTNTRLYLFEINPIVAP